MESGKVWFPTHQIPYDLKDFEGIWNSKAKAYVDKHEKEFNADVAILTQCINKQGPIPRVKVASIAKIRLV